MDLRGSIPCVIRIAHGKIHDVPLLDQVVLEPAALYIMIMDRGYIDFARLYRLTQHAAFFVTRAKSILLTSPACLRDLCRDIPCDPC
jgi:hypothetical protein